MIRETEAEGGQKFYPQPGFWRRDGRRGVSCLLPGSWEEGAHGSLCICVVWDCETPEPQKDPM